MNTTRLCGLILSLLLISVQGQRIAEKECSKFREKTVKKTRTIPLMINPTPITTISSNCSKTINLIVGGVAAKPGEFPHQALLGYKNGSNSTEYKFMCGGSLISERFVLTAAHCMYTQFGNPYFVRLGEHDLTNDYDGQKNFDIKTIKRHPDYSNSKRYHDIALIELTEKVNFSSKIRPACLWTGSQLNLTKVVATGFGFTETGGESAKVLQRVTLDFLETQKCIDQYGRKRIFKEGINDGLLCVGSLEGGKDTCKGDSGGPIQVVTEPKGCIYHIVGVTSTGPGACAVGNSASIYTKVAKYITWIEEQVWPEQSRRG